MTFPTTPILNSLDGPDEGPPITGFADILNGLEISGGEAVGSAALNNNLSYYTTSFSPDQEVYISLNGYQSNAAFGLAGRLHDISGSNFKGYLAIATNASSPGTVALLRYSGGSSVQIYSLEYDFSVGYSLGLKFSGDTIELWAEDGTGWAMIGSVEDGAYTDQPGYPGVYIVKAGLQYFGGGGLITAPSSRTPTPRGTHQSLALPVLVSDPLWWTDRRGYITTLFREISGDSFSITDGIGFDRATLPLKLPRGEADDWLLDGLGRHIVRKNESGVIIWEGFVNLIRYRYGGSSRSIGPLIEMANVVDGVYSTQDTSTTPPTNGERTTVGLNADDDSIERYGEIRQILSLGTTTSTLAERAVLKFLNEKRFPPRTMGESFPGGADMDLTLECLGYGHLFTTYEYNDEVSDGEDNLSVQLLNILNACPGIGIFSGDLSRFSENTLQVPLYVDGSPRAKALIEELLSFGDADDNKYIFGVYAGRQIVYEPTPTEIEYIRRVNDRKQEVEDRAGGRIWPWNVKPGKWMRTPDLLPGRSQPPNLREDIRNTYIVSVSFSSPDRLEVGGDEMEELPQMLAKIQRGVSFA